MYLTSGACRRSYCCKALLSLAPSCVFVPRSSRYLGMCLLRTIKNGGPGNAKKSVVPAKALFWFGMPPREIEPVAATLGIDRTLPRMSDSPSGMRGNEAPPACPWRMKTFAAARQTCAEARKTSQLYKKKNTWWARVRPTTAKKPQTQTRYTAASLKPTTVANGTDLSSPGLKE